MRVSSRNNCNRTCIQIMFTGYVELRERDAYPQLSELPHFLKKACRRFSYPHIGKIEMVKDDSKLLTSKNHLNDHVLHVIYHMLHFFLIIYNKVLKASQAHLDERFPRKMGLDESTLTSRFGERRKIVFLLRNI